MAKIEAVRGMKDIAPSEMPYWHRLEQACQQVVNQYGYQEFRFPVVEKTALFKRGVGEVTDIVEKEMYTFEDRNGDQLTLRPEGTAGCVRAAIEQGLLYNQLQRLWYIGPMFRHERPQRGRYRQFYQLGVEAFGMRDPRLDAELILLSHRLWQRLGIDDSVTLQINTLGSPENRQAYREQLVAYLSEHMDLLDDDAKRRLHTNPLRILDSKNHDMQDMLSKAPAMMAFLDQDARDHFDRVCEYLQAAGLSYEINPRLVRGLDYYCDTVFEWVTDSLGAQGTICAGGRYDGLVEQLGGKSTPAVGFAMGLERIVLMMQQQETLECLPDVYVVVEKQSEPFGLRVSEQLRQHCPNFSVVMDGSAAGLKAQFKRADKSGARFAVVIGEQVASEGVVVLKDLRQNGEQQTLPVDAMLVMLTDYLEKGD